MVTQYLEAWGFVGIDAMNSITLTDTAGPVTVSNTASAPFRTLISELKSLANADATLNGLYTFSIDTAANTVTLACDLTFTYTISASLAEFWGFSAVTQSGSTSYVSDLQPHAFRSMLGVCYDVPQSMDTVELREYRHRRHAAYATHNGRRVRVEAVDTITELRQLIKGPLFGGKVRVHHTASSTAYSLTNLDGYLDVSMAEIPTVALFGPSEDYGRVELVGTLAES